MCMFSISYHSQVSPPVIITIPVMTVNLAAADCRQLLSCWTYFHGSTFHLNEVQNVWVVFCLLFAKNRNDNCHFAE